MEQSPRSSSPSRPLAYDIVFARSLAVPLQKLAEAVRAFGVGTLSARTGVRRHDELGQVAEAFGLMPTLCILPPMPYPSS